MDYFKLTRIFWDFAFENPEKIKPNHCALYLFIIEHCNRLGWKKKFGLPTEMTKEAIGIRSYNTYIQTLNDLVEFGMVDIIEKSKNQYSSNIIALSNFDKALDKALDKASVKHTIKHSESTQQSIDSINKHNTYNILHINNDVLEVEVMEFTFDDFWEIYPNKAGKKKAFEKFNKLKAEDKELIKNHLPFFIKNKPFKDYNYPHATTYLNQERYKDEILVNNNNNFNFTDNEFNNFTKQLRSANPKL